MVVEEEAPTSEEASSTMAATKETVITTITELEETTTTTTTTTQTSKIETLEAASNVATIESNTQGGTESTCNNNDNAESSSLLVNDVDDDARDKSLEFADELMERGSLAVKEGDFTEATDCFSRALEIRVARYGELAPECVNLYYKYGCALLSKAQEDADPLGVVPKKEVESQQDSDKDGSVKNAINGESSTASVSSNAQQDEGSNEQDEAADDVSSGKGQEEDEEDSDVDDLAEADDLDLAWKMLDVARAIVEKHLGDTMEKVDILSSLAEVALEREDVESSLSDYLKALSILERLVEPDSRYIAELNFRICLCLELGSKAQEAIPYCQKALSTCKSRVDRLKREVSLLEPRATSPATVIDQDKNQSSIASESDDAVSNKEAEIGTLSSLSRELEMKLEDLQQLVSNPTSILSELLLGMVAAKARGSGERSASSVVLCSSQMGTANSNGDLDSPTVSTAHTNGAAGVTHLGVVGRGVKRVLMNSGAAESNPSKKPALDPPSEKGEGGSAS